MLAQNFVFVSRLQLVIVRQVIEGFVMPFYAVRTGRNPGIYKDWDSCKSQVDKFPQARYKKFNTQKEAEDFVKGSGGPLRNSYANTYNNGSSSKPANQKPTSNYNAPSTSHKQSLKEQVTHLSAVVHQLSEEIESYEKTHVLSKRSHTPSATHPGGSRSYSTHSSSQYGSFPKRFKHDNSDGGSNSDEAVTVYTDGGCFGNGRKGATAGIGVYWGDNHPDNLSERLGGRQTNNRAEIHATARAISQAKARGITNLVLKTDSQFCINGITNWIHKWKRNGWKLSTGQPVINKADFEELESSLQGINVKWVHVRGHRGVPGNEAADKLANEGALKPEV
ncbi:ribonuclease H1-like [Mytilus californianus]|uniref:ribonuclease H1-like n=1 Tax=Mytilus californianus TaxID=6549 RepID=UPI00224728FC|nr:ribonuclease H1-like [Mytilus californianus]